MIKKWQKNPACRLQLCVGQNTGIPVAVVLDWGIRIIRIAVWGPQHSYSHGSRKVLSMLTCFTPVWPWSFCLSPRHRNWAVKVIAKLATQGDFHPTAPTAFCWELHLKWEVLLLHLLFIKAKLDTLFVRKTQRASEHIAFHCSSTPWVKSSAVFPEEDSLMQH